MEYKEIGFRSYGCMYVCVYVYIVFSLQRVRQRGEPSIRSLWIVI